MSSLNFIRCVEPSLGLSLVPFGCIRKKALDSHSQEAWWTDVPVVILGWWLRENEGLLRASSSEATCLFMDGPFEFILERSGELRLRERRASGTIDVRTVRLSVQAFWKSLHVAASNVVAECDARGWSSGDIDYLRRFIARAVLEWFPCSRSNKPLHLTAAGRAHARPSRLVVS
jgi:hypothetical protein